MNRGHAVLLAVFFLGMGARLALMPLAATGPLWPDERTYLAVADNLREGEGYSARPQMDKESFAAPGYPTFLAALGGSPVLIRFAQAVLGGLAAAALAGAALLLYGTLGAFVAGAAFALYPPFIYYSGRFLVEALYLPLLCFIIFLAAALRRRGGVALSAATGFAAAAASLTRPALLPVAVLLAALSLRRIRLAGALAFVICLAAGLAPWWARNAALHGTFVPFTTGAGWSLYEANNPDATGGVKEGVWPIEEQLAGLTEAEADALLSSEARQFIVKNPGRFLELALVKEKRTWDPVPHAPGFSSGGRAALAAWSYLLLLALGLAGLVAGIARGLPVAIGLMPILATALAHAVYLGSVRYRAPAEVGL
ncbi:MAG TPA: hypothetical protein ENO23_05355, partial [Alphaproteobacteria bacterium]|nr:hypothetical protein [Alphaproteobacteria bacterium]